MSPKKKGVEGKKSDLLRDIILTKLRTIRKEKFGPKSIDKFSLAFRVFLLRYLNLNYEFTVDELINELKKKKIQRKLSKSIIEILNFITEVEYENRKISKEEFRSLLEHVGGVISQATGKSGKKNEKEEETVKEGLLSSFLHKIGAVKTKEEIESSKKLKKIEEKKIFEEEKKRLVEGNNIQFDRKKELEGIKRYSKQNEEDKKKLEAIMRQRQLEMANISETIPGPDKKINNIQLIKEKIYEGKVMLRELNFNDTKRIYGEIIKIYIYLDPKEQAHVYNDIMDLYNQRISKESVKREKIKLF